MDIINVDVSNIDSELANGIVLLDVWSSDCAPCVAFGKLLPAIAEAVGSVKILKLSVSEDANRKWAVAKGVRGIPAVFIYKNGSVVKSWTGLKNKDFVIEELKSLL